MVSATESNNLRSSIVDTICIFIEVFFSFEIVSEVESKDIGNIASRISKTNESNVVQIRGLPWAVDKAYIMKLFPSKKNKWLWTFFYGKIRVTFIYDTTIIIFCSFFAHLFADLKVSKNRIQIEVDENNRRTGYAYVEFENIDDYNAAFETDFKHINQ